MLFDIMNLGQFLKAIEHHTKDISNREDMEVVFSTDDEGNDYKKVHYEPTLCKIESSDRNDDVIVTINMLGDGEIDKADVNAICIT